MLRFIWDLMKKDRRKFILACILGIGTIPVVVYRGALGGQLVDDVLKAGNTNRLWLYLTLLLSLTVVRAILNRAANLMAESVSQNAAMSLRQKMYAELCKMDFVYFDKTRTGSIMTKMTADVEMVRYAISYALRALPEQAVLFIGGICILSFFSWKITLMMLVPVPFVLMAMLFMSRRVYSGFAKVRQMNSDLNTTVQENISGNKVVKAFAKEAYETEKFNQKNENYKGANVEAAYIFSGFLPWFEVMASSLTVIAVLAGGYYVMTGDITIGQLFIINSLLWTINQPMRLFAWLINDLQKISASIVKIQEVLYLKPKIKSKRNAYKGIFKGDVEFDHVSFSYEDQDTLTDISFKARAGQTVAIIGATGAGKSSLINLICRFYDVTGGSVKIDDVDVRDADMKRLRQSVSVAMQDIFLFSDTIEGNIAYGRPDASQEEVIEAAKIADAHEFIMNMPQGYDTIIGERGVGLSGGQRQRIALARALLKSPSILILDDTTSSVDMETEHQIFKTLRSYFAGKTTFIIAHRISTVKDADLILVLDQGRLIEQGSHEELLHKNGYYADIYQKQMGGSCV